MSSQSMLTSRTVEIAIHIVGFDMSPLSCATDEADPKRGLTLSGEANKPMKSTRLQRV